jgi:hypothetical protein
MREQHKAARPARAASLFFGTLALSLAIGCSAAPSGQSNGGAGNGGSGGLGGNNGGTGGGIGGGIGGGVGGGLGGGSTGGAAQACKVTDDDAQNAPVCTQKAPADAFAPSVQWAWTAPAANPAASLIGSFATPLVGNFTDDNGDGAIDLCDTPDILVTAIDTFEFGGGAQLLISQGYIYMLAGDTGVEELKFPTPIDTLVYPAFGDIDNDGLPDVIAADAQGHLVALRHDGTVKWTSPMVGGYRTTFASAECTTIAIYDLDGDGNPEILFGWEVYNNQGQRLFGDPTNASEWDSQYWCVTPTAADLDGDGKLEVIMGHEAYRADGSIYYKLQNFPPAHPQIANLDDDPEPEIFLTNMNGITILEHTGAIKFGPVRPTDPNPAPNCWGKPAVVHDFDGDGKAEIAAATCTDYTVYQVGAQNVAIKWSANVSDQSGLATATAFDFLGDGVAEAIYADETQIYVFDGKTGAIDLTAARQSGTLIEYPVVADVDNDGSAEIVFVSNYGAGTVAPTLTVLRDEQERWIPARRIWNQYSYHVTNVREDGTIPKVMKKSWQLLNTFRTNSQISANGVDCNPEEPPQ